MVGFNFSIILIYWRGNFAFHHWGYTSIYLPFSSPLMLLLIFKLLQNNFFFNLQKVIFIPQLLSKVFTKQSLLNNHMIKHNGCSCEICDEKFTSIKSLKEQLRFVSLEILFSKMFMLCWSKYDRIILLIWLQDCDFAVLMDLLLLGSYTRLSCALIKWNL